MVSGGWEGSADIYASGATMKTVEDFCYLGSYVSTTGNCDQEVNVRIGKASGVFSKLNKLWKSKKISWPVKTRLYEALVLFMLLNSVELWPVSVTQMKKKLEEAHHRWQRSILGISWKDKVTNEKVREATALPKLKDIIRLQTSEMAWTSFTNISPLTSTTSSHMRTRGFQDETRSTTTELERCRQERSQENVHQLGRG